MKKKNIVLISCVACVTIMFIVLSDAIFHKNSTITKDNELLTDNNFVTKAEATGQIMRTIGMTDEIARRSITDHSPAEDIDTEEYLPMGFMYAALNQAQIAKPDKNKLFHPNNNITLKEAVNMIVMCLQKEWIDYDDSLEIAIKKKIIRRNDSFYSKGNDKYITQDDLNILIQRLKKQKRYKYYQEVDRTSPNKMDSKTLSQVIPKYESEFQVDDERSMTYSEYMAIR